MTVRALFALVLSVDAFKNSKYRSYGMRSFAAVFAIIIVTLALLAWRGMAVALLRHQGACAVTATI